MKNAEAEFTAEIRTALGRIPSRDLYEPLYHFTDSVGLDGILRTRSLWASLAASLKDSSEIEYALSRASNMLERGNLTGARRWGQTLTLYSFKPMKAECSRICHCQLLRFDPNSAFSGEKVTLNTVGQPGVLFKVQ